MKRRIIASVLALTLVASAAFANSADADAAKKVKLSAKSKSIAVKKSFTLKVKNGSKKAKVSWKTSNKKVAALSKQVKKGNKASVKVTGKKKGSAKITATYKLGKKKTTLTCKVAVGKVVKPTLAPATVVPTTAPTTAPTVAPPVVTATVKPTATPTAKPKKTPKPTPTATPVPSPDAQIYKTSKAITVDGTIDAAWAFVDAMPIANWTLDPAEDGAPEKAPQSSNAFAKIMWSDTMMYVMVSVDDPEIDLGNEAVYYQDSIELFFDEYNKKHEWGGGNEFQYRTVLNPEAESIGSLTDKQHWDGEEITTAFKTSETGYVVEYSIPLHEAPVEGNFTGIEIQVNDASAGFRNGTWNLFAKPADGDPIPYDSTAVFGDCQYAIKREAKVIELDFTNPENRNMELPTQFSARDENDNILFYDADGNVVCIGVVDPAVERNKIVSYTDASGNPITEKVGTMKPAADYATMNTESFFDDENNAMHCKTANNAIVRFPDGRSILPGEKAEVRIKGTYTGENGFRIWLVDTSAGLSDAAATTSNQVTVSADDLEKAKKDDGTFELVVELTGSEDDKGAGYSNSDAVMIKAPSYNGQLDDLVFTSVVLTVYDPLSNEDMVDPEPTTPPTDEPTAPPTDEPTAPPTDEPTAPPTDEPTAPPTDEPTVPPTDEPTVPPTDEPTVPPTDEPTEPGKYVVDLSNAESYHFDGGTSAEYDAEANALNVTVPDFNGIIIKNKAEDAQEYKYAKVTYVINGTLKGYIFDGELGNNGIGQGAAGETEKDNLTGTGEEKTVIYEAAESLLALKIVRVSFMGADTGSIALKSVEFYKENPAAETE